MNALTLTRPRLNVLDIADRVIAGGAYARFSQQDQLALCLFVSELRPHGDEAHRITIIAAPTEDLPVEAQATRMNAAKAAADGILTTGRAPLPSDVEDAIAGVLDARKRLLAHQHSAIAASGARLELQRAIDLLETAFAKGRPDEQH